MKIIISGCGKIGEAILASLVREGHELTVIDNDPEVIRRITNTYDVMGICGSGTDWGRLNDADVAHTALFVSAVDSDEVNMLSCFVAKRLGAAHTVARIRETEHNDSHRDYLRRELDLDMAINPEALAARSVFENIKFPSAVKVDSFSRRTCEVVEFTLKADSPLVGQNMIGLRRQHTEKFIVCAVRRGETTVIPGGTFSLAEGDRIALIAARDEMEKLLKSLGLTKKKGRDVMILGASRTAFYLSRMLIDAGNAVTMIDRDKARCKEASETLPDGVTVICGNGMKPDLLEEEGLSEADAFVALTGMDEVNILMSFYAKGRKVPRVITKVNQQDMASLGERMDLECLTSPGHITADLLVSYARALENSIGSNVETLYRLMDDAVEALEFAVKTDFGSIDVPLKDLKCKPNVRIAAIIRGSKTLIPGGDDVIREGDRVIVVVSGERLNDLSDAFDD